MTWNSTVMNNLNKYLDTIQGYTGFKILTSIAKLPFRKVVPIYNNKWVWVSSPRTPSGHMTPLNLCQCDESPPKKAHLLKFAG